MHISAANFYVDQLGLVELKRTRSKSTVAPHILAPKSPNQEANLSKIVSRERDGCQWILFYDKETITGKELIYKHQKENKAQDSSLKHPV